MDDLKKLEKILFDEKDGFAIKLRFRSDIDPDILAQAEEAKKILKRLAEAWKGSDCIPKKACAVFVDFYPAMESCAAYYDKESADMILKIADEIMELIRSCCNIT